MSDDNLWFDDQQGLELRIKIDHITDTDSTKRESILSNTTLYLIEGHRHLEYTLAHIVHQDSFPTKKSINFVFC